LKKLLSSSDIEELENHDEKFKTVIAENLVTMRRMLKKSDSKWGQETIAEFFNVSISTYKRWEKHGVDSISMSWMVRYKQLFFMCCPEHESKAGEEMMGEFVALFESAMGLLKLPSKFSRRENS
tara:strand:- start:1236 stop:1607 length:372 start_codon:yes stop_codon:yes gene_type:complete